jgi:hypothetical protein
MDTPEGQKRKSSHGAHVFRFSSQSGMSEPCRHFRVVPIAAIRLPHSVVIFRIRLVARGCSVHACGVVKLSATPVCSARPKTPRSLKRDADLGVKL